MVTPLLPSSASIAAAAAVVETAVPLGGDDDDSIDDTEKQHFTDIDLDADADADEEYKTNDKTVETKCSLVNKSYLRGILTGLCLQGLSFILTDQVKSISFVTSNVVLTFTAYVFSRYWMPVALLLPAAFVAVRSRSLPGHLRLDAFFQSLRFQFGLFFGSLMLLSVVNLYSLASTAPWPLLMAYYGVCLSVSFLALCLLQCFVNEVCANVSSIEVIVNYEDNTPSSSSSSSSPDEDADENA
jgi:hypothetical protein